MKRGFLIVVAVAACGPAAAPVAPAPAPSGVATADAGVDSGVVIPATVGVHAVEGDVFLAPNTAPAKGRLVIAWRSPAQDAEERAGKGTMGTARAMLERWAPGEVTDFAITPRVHYRLDGAPPDAVPVVMLDIDHSFMATMFGGGQGLIGVAEPGKHDVMIAPNPKRPSGETCVGDRMQLIVVHAPEVAGSIGNDTERRFCAWLPQSYSSSPKRRYPVVFFFGGLMSTDRRFVGNWHPGTLADNAAKDTGREVIVVAPDLSTKTGSSYLEDSPVTGQWDTFFARRAVPAIDAALRTMPRRTGRAVVGHSTGGHNALSYGMRHSDLFGAIGASSPDPPDMEAWLFRADTHAPQRWLVKLVRLEDALGGPGQMTSYAADWSPDSSARGWAWPFDPQSGAPAPDVITRWVARSPVGLLQNPAALARIKKDLGKKILITIGHRDEFDLSVPAGAFSDRLTRAGVEHVFRPTQGGHTTNLEKQLDDALRFVIAKLDPAK